MVNAKVIQKILECNMPDMRVWKIFLHSLKPISAKVFICIPYGIENARSSSDIKDLTGISTHNIASLINTMSKNYPIKHFTEGKNHKYYL